MKILVKVTQEVLERSRFCDDMPSDNCAITLAIRELFPLSQTGMTAIHFYENIQNFKKGYTRERSNLPEVAKSFIKWFDISTPDERRNLVPFSFEIDVPDAVIQKIGIGEVYRVLSESRTLEHVNP